MARLLLLLPLQLRVQVSMLLRQVQVLLLVCEQGLLLALLVLVLVRTVALARYNCYNHTRSSTDYPHRDLQGATRVAVAEATDWAWQVALV